MKVGDKWARLTCTGETIVDRVAEYDGGSDSWQDAAWEIECECGAQVVVTKREFKGKRVTRDCGCGLAKDDGMTVNLCVCMPLTLRRQVQEYAQRESMSTSHAMAVLLRRGFEVTNVVNSTKGV